MARRRALLGTLWAPVTVAVVFAAGVAWYSLVWVPGQRQYFTNRNLRILARLGEGLKAKIDNLDTVLEHAAEIRESQRNAYFRLQVSNLVDVSRARHADDNTRKTAETAGDPPSLEISADEGTFVLVFRYKDGAAPFTSLSVKTRVDKLIVPGQIPDAFDTFIIARARDGQVIYQYSRATSEARLTQLDSLVEAKGGKPVALGSLVKASAVTEITLASADYMLFSEPLQLSYPSVVKTAAADQRADPETWVLCGLVSSRRLASTSRAISLTYILWFATALLLLLFSHPFVRLFTAGRTTRLRARDPALLAGSTFALVMLVTLALLGAYHFHLKPDPEIDGQLVSFADEVKGHFKAEQAEIWRQLEAFEQAGDYADASHDVSIAKKTSLRQTDDQLSGRPGLCEPKSACKIQMLSEATKYPFLQSTFWSDELGQQRVKWTVRDIITPFLNLEQDSPAYYAEARAAWQWGGNNPVPRMNPSLPPGRFGRGVSTLLSPNTGETITVFWNLLESKPAPSSSEPRDPELPQAEAPHRLVMGALVTKPVSLVQPLVGGDLRFAVIDRRGLVLYHSDPTRNLSENLLSETDGDSRLQALVGTGASGLLTTNYSGRRHQFYVTPLDVPRVGTEPWSLVAFRSLDRQETVNIETFSLTSMFFLVYAGLIALVWAAVRLWAPSAARWSWPAEMHAQAYRHVVVVNLLVIGVFVVCIAVFDSVGLGVAAVVVPLVALGFALRELGSARAAGASRLVSRLANGRLASLGWRHGYLLAMTSLLIVTSILPTIAFFKISYDFEKRLLVRLSQVQLASQWRERQARMAADYRNVASREKVLGRLQEELGSNDAYWKHNSAFQTVLSRMVEERSDHQLGLGDTLLANWIRRVRPPYNDEASEMRALLEPSTWRDFTTTSQAQGVTDLYVNRELSMITQSTWRPWSLPSDPVWWGGLLAWTALVFGAIRRVSRKVYLTDLSSVRPDPTTWTFQDGHVLVLGPPLSGKTRRVRALSGVHTIDLRNLTRRQRRLSPATPTGTAPPSESLADTIDFQALPPDLSIPVVLDHFEHRMAEGWWPQQRLELLEQLAFRYQRKIAVVSAVDPLDCLDGVVEATDQSAEAQQQRAAFKIRWAVLLSSFERREYGFAANEQRDVAVETLAGRLSNVAPSERAPIVDVFERECAALPWLQSIGMEAVDQLSRDGDLTADQLFNEVATRAESCYRALWTACSKDEKLALVQLAEEGIVNPQNAAIIRRLAAKGLVSCRPRPRVVTDGFARFVAMEATPATVAKWEAEDQGIPWNTLLWVTVLSASAFLFVSQQEVAKAWMAYLTGASAAIPALLKLTSSLRSPGSEQKA